MHIRTVGVVGLGTMGAGIAQVCLEAGHDVVATDLYEPARAAGHDRIAFGVSRRVAKGAMTTESGDAALARLRIAEPTDVAACDLIIEAIVEELAPKQDLFRHLHDLAPAGAIFATNTSALSVTAIGARSGRPERVVGLHFFNPAPLMPLVEVVRTAVVATEVFDLALAFASGLGKEAVACPDTPGFIVNRVLVPMLNDAVRAFDETRVEPADFDRALRAGAGWPMGPLALVDLVGVDVQVHASEALFAATREPRMAPPVTLQRMVEAGRLGRKTGRGFYSYDG